MAKRQFKTESKKLLNMMINSIYTHKEIFLREVISNASDAIDKLYFQSLTDDSITMKRGDYEIRLTPDKKARTLTISDNGIGMDDKELEQNLGTIARSGSLDFKAQSEASEDSGKESKETGKTDQESEKQPDTEDGQTAESENAENQEDQDTAVKEKDIDIIGQFGVGFYSVFMVSDDVKVISRKYGSEQAYRWESKGVDGYTITPCEKETNGTEIILHLKPDAEGEDYSQYLETYELEDLIHKYSDYIRYPIRMQVTKSRKKEGSPDDKPEYEDYTEDETINSMVPLWKKPTSEVTDEQYASFYQQKFMDYEAPLKTIRLHSEGTSEFTALLFIPSHAPYNFYTREYEKGLQLYSSSVMIMDKCKDLIPDCFSFVRGLVDTDDLPLNVSRETLQENRQVRIMARAIEKKIANELGKMQDSDREKYDKFYASFGTQLKYGIYSDYGAHKDMLQDLLMFYSSYGDKPVTFKEYVSRMKEGQDKIYYASAETKEQAALLPQVESVVSHGYEVLYLTEEIDEFALQMMQTYAEKKFSDVCKDDVDLTSEEEKKALKEENDRSADMFAFMKKVLGDQVDSVRFTNMLKDHAAALSSEGELSMTMEKALNRMPGAENNQLKAKLVLEINLDHPIATKLRLLYATDQDKLTAYTKILYAQARLVSGMPIANATEVSDLVADLMTEDVPHEEKGSAAPSSAGEETSPVEGNSSAEETSAEEKPAEEDAASSEDSGTSADEGPSSEEPSSDEKSDTTKNASDGDKTSSQ